MGVLFLMSFLFPLKPCFFVPWILQLLRKCDFFLHWTFSGWSSSWPGWKRARRVVKNLCSGMLTVTCPRHVFPIWIFRPFLKYSVAHGDRDETIRLHVWDAKELHWGAQTICTSVHDAAVPKEGRPERGTIHLIKFLDKIKGLMWKVGKIFSRDSALDLPH